MLEAAFWGLIQGLTEFLPISSSGHLVLVPALLGQEPPDLATSAMLHMGTLLAVLIYFRREVVEVVTFTDKGRRLLLLLLVGTIPAAVLGLTFESQVEWLNERPRGIAIALFLTGVVLFATRWIQRGTRTAEEATFKDTIIIGLGQALALIPGVSRSGSTISTGLLRGFTDDEAARYSFLLGIPAIAGAGVFEGKDLLDSGSTVGAEILVGVAVAAISGYLAIAFLLRLIGRTGLSPFGLYCMAAGTIAFIIL
ncbi:MAG: undecaprenyl-diphosphate phosphatase [bacterium]|nr:undecaprenyl-diphosphate phosphatase [bacterium]MCP4968586.1 undecaprenyl-diphosphate phosphatase [bacterium]